MVESKDFRKGIFQLEWEHKKMKMQVEDLNQKARDIQKLNVTKDHQIVSYYPNFYIYYQDIKLYMFMKISCMNL